MAEITEITDLQQLERQKQYYEIHFFRKAFLTTLLAKLLLKAPVNHLLVRNMQFLDPRLMVSKK